MRARDNPFRTESLLRVRYRLEDISWADLLQRCEELSYRAALVGRRGSGKTTLLEDLGPRLRERGFEPYWLRLNEEHTFERGTLSKMAAAVTHRHIVLLDGAEQLNWLAWQVFKRGARRAGGLIITVHEAMRLPTMLECRTTPALLADIIADILGTRTDRLSMRPEQLFHKHQGNLRDALRECYDAFAYAQLQPGSTPAGSLVLS
jgi:hypothetical protein